MLTQDQIQALKAPFPPEALSSDISHGFELTSIKAAFVIERLNEVFGPCGVGWRYAHSPFEELQTDNGRVEIEYVWCHSWNRSMCSCVIGWL